MDDMRFAAYSSAKTRSKNYTFNETGDAIVRELDLSRITLRLVAEQDKKGDSKEDAHRAKLSVPTLDALKRSLYTPHWVTLRDDHGHDSKIRISMKYLPIKMQLDPSESMNNQGHLRVEVLDAADLPAADRNGFSDPYCRFILNGKEVHKTKVQKKTLHPAWNEFFEIPVASRTAAKFECNVYDWDFGDKADFLGATAINLDLLEPFQAREVTLALDGKSGSIRLKLLFKPDYVTRSRMGSSTFSGTFATPGKIIGAPVKGVGKVAGGVGSGVLKGASFVGRTFRRKDKHEEGDEEDSYVADIQETTMETDSIAGRPSTAADTNGHAIPSIEAPSDVAPPRTPHQRQPSSGAFSTTPSAAPAGDNGTASITVASIAGFEEKEHKLEVVILQDTGKGFKEVFKTKAIKTKTGEAQYDEESKSIPCSAAQQFKVAVRSHKTFGGDDEMGEAPFFINDQASGGEQEINVGDGVVVLRTSFQPSDDAPGSPAASMKHRSLGRFMSRRDRSVTPSS